MESGHFGKYPENEEHDYSRNFPQIDSSELALFRIPWESSIGSYGM